MNENTSGFIHEINGSLLYCGTIGVEYFLLIRLQKCPKERRKLIELSLGDSYILQPN